MVSKPTTTSFALLGLLGLKPWTAYELVAQVKRGVYFFWPRSEAHLYAELKRLVERGHADAEIVDGPKRQRTRYTITPKGLAALDDWFTTPPAEPVVESEAFLRLFLGDQTTADDLRATLEITAQQARQFHTTGMALITEILDDGGPFPHRLHLIAPMVAFLDDFYRQLVTWCEDTADEIDSWPSTRDVGLTPKVRAVLQQILDRPAP